MGPYDGMNLIRKDPYDGLGKHEESPYDGTSLMNPITFSSNGNSVYSNSKGNHNNKDDKYENKVGNKSNNISKYSSKKDINNSRHSNNTNNKNNIKKISTHHMKPISTYNEYGAGIMDHDSMDKEKWFHAQDMGKEVFQMTSGYDTNHALKMELRTDRVHGEGHSTGSQDQGVNYPIRRNTQFLSKPDYSNLQFGFKNSTLQKSHNTYEKVKPGVPEEDHQSNRNNKKVKQYKDTPKRKGIEAPRKKLFECTEEEVMDSNNNDSIDNNNSNNEERTNIEVVPIGTDLEVLLINSCGITAGKVQEIINEFMTEKEYTTLFCLTETKVRGHELINNPSRS